MDTVVTSAVLSIQASSMPNLYAHPVPPVRVISCRQLASPALPANTCRQTGKSRHRPQPPERGHSPQSQPASTEPAARPPCDPTARGAPLRSCMPPSCSRRTAARASRPACADLRSGGDGGYSFQPPGSGASAPHHIAVHPIPTGSMHDDGACAPRPAHAHDLRHSCAA